MSDKNSLLIVEILKASNLPKEKAKPNPFVNLTFRGAKKKSNHKKSEINPVWNEVSLKIFDQNSENKKLFSIFVRK